ncbi:MAG TPA: 16S rRNA (adenine(1518)-N(6)/adenine(1519)-N(6))-dimethyltransferase [Alphaproteobacteria bacterium]|nr:16S rRNA (adenine(1518)-N(6)/adenine(1519)-N(6))-dimethyltransferase [Alphaproteobacteria bacterium]HAJ48260.1 16S rRNA (adenine(1518)-N(6)/adenine(1519)-N(6))-dimethyltransferase [Alphaproteobacteria bacterium]
MTEDTLPPLRDVIAAHGLQAKKSLGQNFLYDLNLTRRIARAGGPLSGHTILEVGPGPGGLTRALLSEGATQVIAIERDPRCLAALAEISAAWPGHLTVVQGDATQVDQAALVYKGTPVRIVANLPYNVATMLLVSWLTTPAWPPWWASLTLMFQREVAERLVATPSTKSYGRLSILTQWRSTAKVLFDVHPQAFVPAPKVTSSVVRIEPRAAPLADAPLSALERVTAAAFGQRRKMLRASLRTLSQDALAILERAGVNPEARAEDLTIEQFCAIARTWSATTKPG